MKTTVQIFKKDLPRLNRLSKNAPSQAEYISQLLDFLEANNISYQSNFVFPNNSGVTNQVSEVESKQQ